MTSLDRAAQLAHELYDRVYRVERGAETKKDYEYFFATLGCPDGALIHIAVSSTNTWEIK